jgi:hypothetical protein
MTNAQSRPSRPCTWDGCHAWAMRGERYCSAHRNRAAQVGADQPSAMSERERRCIAFAEAVLTAGGSGMLDDALRGVIAAGGTERSLEPEIGVLRLALSRVVAVEMLDGDPHDVARTVARLTSEIARIVRIQQAVNGDATDVLAMAVSKVLGTMGLGDDA